MTNTISNIAFSKNRTLQHVVGHSSHLGGTSLLDSGIGQLQYSRLYEINYSEIIYCMNYFVSKSKEFKEIEYFLICHCSHLASYFCDFVLLFSRPFQRYMPIFISRLWKSKPFVVIFLNLKTFNNTYRQTKKYNSYTICNYY